MVVDIGRQHDVMSLVRQSNVDEVEVGADDTGLDQAGSFPYRPVSQAGSSVPMPQQ